MLNLIRLSLAAAVAFATASPAAAGPSTSSPVCFGRPATIVGTPGPDTIIGTPGPDVIAGLGGNDTIEGRGGADLICGGAGADLIKGGAGRDRVRGGRGNDIIVGGGGRDRAFGGAGIDGCDAEFEYHCEGDPVPPNPGDSKDCGDFATQAEAQAWFDRHYPLYGDIARLDRDRDGVACEGLPGPD
ncbi:MAG: hypothetical protein FJW79_11520 [Actinobacteria bacterium]|nr:hypothetical protein [Actinomycetota bacterium]